MILKHQLNSILDHSKLISAGLIGNFLSMNNSMDLVTQNSGFSYQLEKMFDILLHEYQNAVSSTNSTDYMNRYINRIKKRGIPEIHMKKTDSNTKLRTCNDMSGILGKI